MSESRYVMGIRAQAIVVFLTLLVASSAHAEESPALVSQVRTQFQKKNAKVEDVTLLELVPVYGRSLRYLVLAHGIRQDVKFEGSFEEELFGLFVVDQSFTKILATVDIFPTERWNDYSVQIKKPIFPSIVLVCQGTTYGDVNRVRRYSVEVIHGKPTPALAPKSKLQ
ncbi:MAG: hypothetical protein L0387_27290 [Acidobacteria bacterium]|nr:hypothetical protein [Acidobacteriota bacterium]MCI0724118.1 hypothetical protein [Acidobacteriota bacterium]